MVSELTALLDANRWLFIALLPLIYMSLAVTWLALLSRNNRASSFTIKGFGLSVDVDIGRRSRKGDQDAEG